MAGETEVTQLEDLLSRVDHLLELPSSELRSADQCGSEINNFLRGLLDSSELDPDRRGHLTKISAAFDAALARLSQSMHHLGKGDGLSRDWERFARSDLVRLKDEALALREFMVSNADLLKSARGPARQRKSGGTDLEGLIEDLRDERAIGDRTWALFMSYLGAADSPWKREVKDKGVPEQLARISGWLSDLREVRGAGDVRQTA